MTELTQPPHAHSEPDVPLFLLVGALAAVVTVVAAVGIVAAIIVAGG